MEIEIAQLVVSQMKRGLRRALCRSAPATAIPWVEAGPPVNTVRAENVPRPHLLRHLHANTEDISLLRVQSVS
jgi:hypothetical protein